jgi:hypothetical protein
MTDTPNIALYQAGARPSGPSGIGNQWPVISNQVWAQKIDLNLMGAVDR